MLKKCWSTYELFFQKIFVTYAFWSNFVKLSAVTLKVTSAKKMLTSENVVFQSSLTLWELISQNGQTHSNNSSANCLSVFDHFVGLAFKGLRCFFIKKSCSVLEIFNLLYFKSFYQLRNVRPPQKLMYSEVLNKSFESYIIWHLANW